MVTHKNALLTPRGREAMARSVIEGSLSKAAAAHQFNTTPKTVVKRVGRFQAEGVAGFHCDNALGERKRKTRAPPPGYLFRNAIDPSPLAPCA
jgi:hypothetical protein